MGRSKDALIEKLDYPELDEGDYYDEVEPFADPNIRRQYEAALGEFIVAFNELDDLVVQVVGYACQVVGRSVPRNINGYAASVDLLDILGGSNVLQLHGAPIAEMRELGKMRNLLAHGHFDQNPFDGSYRVVQRSGKPRYVTAEAISQWSERAFKAYSDLKPSDASFWFRVETVKGSADPEAKF